MTIDCCCKRIIDSKDRSPMCKCESLTSDTRHHGDLNIHRTYRVFSKKCFFHNPLQPISRVYIAARDFRSYQSNESIESLLLAGHFCTTNSSPVLAMESSQNAENSSKKNHNFFLNSLYLKELVLRRDIDNQ